MSDANQQQRESGLAAANQGLSYFEKDVKYDKRFYTNDWKDILLIILALIIFYLVFSIIFWGMVAFCTCYSSQAMWTNVGLIIATVIWILTQVTAGHYTNQKLHLWEFYMEKINDKEQEERDRHQREEQRRKQEEKLAAQKLSVAHSSSLF